jgi:hypothetical protein
MAKELPYYQFEVAEYLAGDIMICSLEAQGLFSVIKCLYWQKECCLNTKQVLKRYDKQPLIDELIEEGCIKVNKDGNITIDFLYTQYQQFAERRNKLSEAGRRGGLHKKEATLKPGLKESEATPKHIEDIRVDNNKEDKIIINDNKLSIEQREYDFKKSILQYQNKYSIDLLKAFFNHWSQHGDKDKKMLFEKQKSFQISKRLVTWKNNETKFNKSTPKTEDPRKHTNGQTKYTTDL